LGWLAEHLRQASRVTVLTGAGVSAASGVATFRGVDGMWNRMRPEDLATPEAFTRDPRLVWEWYTWRRQQIAACRPNAAHDVLAQWSRRLAHCRVITQNVDDLHLAAGTERLIRLHGSIWDLCCLSACAGGRTPWRDEDAADTTLRRCPHCGGVARPGVVWFGEALDPDVVDEAVVATACDVFLTVGTSAVVYPAAGLLQQAKASGAVTAEINPEATPASGIVDVAIQAPAERVLPELDRLLGDDAPGTR
jgi:NAD-dependent deacetylase